MDEIQYYSLMKKCLIIGGGLAGLSTAVYLIKKSYKVTLLEATPKLGGRTYSFYSEKHKQYVDNGQHIMMGCYNDTLEFLKMINALDEIEIQDNLKVPVQGEKGEFFYLASKSKFYPLNLFFAILNYKALTLQERFSVLNFFITRIFYNAGKLENVTVSDWLRKNGQTENSISALWEMLAVGTLNSQLESSSAFLFREILKTVFFTGNNSTKIILPKKSLSETFSKKAETFILKHGGEILLSERVKRITLSHGEITEVESENSKYRDFDLVISAIPLQAFEKLVFYPQMPRFIFPRLEYSPIVSVHIWLKKNDFGERFYNLLNSRIHWLFNHNSHITLVTSAADELVNLSHNEIIRLFCLDIKKYFPNFDINNIADSLVIKEKSATFLPAIESNIARKEIFNPVSNLFLSGDWIDTKLPATIEGAIKSGKMAADWVVKSKDTVFR